MAVLELCLCFATEHPYVWIGGQNRSVASLVRQACGIWMKTAPIFRSFFLSPARLMFAAALKHNWYLQAALFILSLKLPFSLNYLPEKLPMLPIEWQVGKGKKLPAPANDGAFWLQEVGESQKEGPHEAKGEESGYRLGFGMEMEAFPALELPSNWTRFLEPSSSSLSACVCECGRNLKLLPRIFSFLKHWV